MSGLYAIYFIPQVMDIKPPQPMDVAGEYFVYAWYKQRTLIECYLVLIPAEKLNPHQITKTIRKKHERKNGDLS